VKNSNFAVEVLRVAEETELSRTEVGQATCLQKWPLQGLFLLISAILVRFCFLTAGADRSCRQALKVRNALNQYSGESA
jgi:hypothetical protein